MRNSFNTIHFNLAPLSLALPMFLMFTGCKEDKPSTPPPAPTSSTTATQAPPTRPTVYHEMRDAALAYRIPNASDRITKHAVHGIVVDWALDEGAVTIVFMNDGCASLYTSSGGGTIGAGDHPSVRDAGKRVLNEAVKIQDQMTTASKIELPPAGSMRFTLITDEGLRTAVDTVDRLSNNIGFLAPLGNEVQTLIFEINKASGR